MRTHCHMHTNTTAPIGSELQDFSFLAVTAIVQLVNEIHLSKNSRGEELL